MTYIDRKHAAELLGVHLCTIDRWIRRGVLKASQPFPRAAVRIDPKDIEALKRPRRKAVK